MIYLVHLKKNPTHFNVFEGCWYDSRNYPVKKYSLQRRSGKIPVIISSTAHQVFGLSMDNDIVSAFSGCSPNFCYNPTYHFCSQSKLHGLGMSNAVR